MMDDLLKLIEDAYRRPPKKKWWQYAGIGVPEFPDWLIRFWS